MRVKIWKYSMVYRLMRVLFRLLLGRERRDYWFHKIGWSSSLDYMTWLFSKLYLGIGKVNYFFEPEVAKCLMRLRGDLFIDIGANLGSYSLLLSPNFNAIFAIEPHPITYNNLIANIKNSGYPNVCAFQVAISDKTEKNVPLYLGRQSGRHTLLSKKELSEIARKQRTGEYVLVQTLTLSDLIRHYSIRKVDLVKVDVEGAELKVLKGAENVLNKIKKWLVEVHKNVDKKDVEIWFAMNGYRYRWLDYTHIFAFKK